MKIESITIKNFKSIKELTIPLRNYGEGNNSSSTTILVGLNESGKSSILEAINFIEVGLEQVDYSNNFHKNSDEVSDIYIDIYLDFIIENQVPFKEQISKSYPLAELDDYIINLSSVSKNVWKSSKDWSTQFFVAIDANIDFEDYIYKEGILTTVENYKVKQSLPKELNSIEVKSTLAPEAYVDKDRFEGLIAGKLDGYFESYVPKVQFWKPQKEFLINEKINLEEFKNNPEKSIPLRNIFYLKGYTSGEEILFQIEKALKKSDYKAQLERELSKTITSFINKAWKEHKINIVVRIENEFCEVFVEDKDNLDRFFGMSQRSDGFKQFISLLLTLSTSNSSKVLSNNIILLDEPETHLHPSGIRYMRDELLKIGKNNHVIIATHSHYMIDTTTPERHFIVSKQKMETKIEQVDRNTSMLDDEVVAKAFGVNLFKELLPNNILFVEGGDDKAVLSHALNLTNKSLSYSIKSAGGASKVYGSLSLLAHDDIRGIKVIALFDDDKEGRDAKNDILKRLKDYYTTESIKTIRDLVSSLPKDATVEDLLPLEFVKNFFESEMGQEFLFENGKALINQIKNQCQTLKENKTQLESKKVKLSNTFIERYTTKEQLENEAPMLIQLIESLVAIMKGYDK